MGDDAGSQLEVGDTVAVPGGMTGTVKYLGPVEGKKGTFAGVELSTEYSARGKNDGDVEGIRYFTTTIKGAGIFLPSHRAMRQYSPSFSASTFPPTPTTPSFGDLNLNRTAASSRTPPTSSVHKFSQSLGPGAKNPFSQTIGPGARAVSPTQKLRPKPRPSLPRPESPFRKPPSLQPMPAKPAGTPAKGSIRGIRPSATASPLKTPKAVTPSPARSQSRTQSRQGPLNSSPLGESTPTPVALSRSGPRPSIVQPLENQEVNRLRRELDERDKQLKDQAVALAEMESNLSEVQALVAAGTSQNGIRSGSDTGSDGGDASDFRSTIKAKDEKIQTMQIEFDSHRAQFRSTLDALQVSYAETERIYEQQQKDLEQDLAAARTNQDDIAEFARQVEEMEHSVVEMEQDLESARRDLADKSAEIEHLKSELEVVRVEARQEREKAASALKARADGPSSPDTEGISRELADRVDEIKGLKLIIHGLSTAKTNGKSAAPGTDLSGVEEQLASLRSENKSLQGLLDGRHFREEELERENARLRNASGVGNEYTNGHVSRNSRSSFYPRHKATDSSSSYKMAGMNRFSNTSAATVVRPSSNSDSYVTPPQGESRPSSVRPKSSPTVDEEKTQRNGGSVDEESEMSGTEPDAQWCEMCETSGHDILHCSQTFGEPINGDGFDETLHRRKVSMVGQQQTTAGRQSGADPDPETSTETEAEAEGEGTPMPSPLSYEKHADSTPKANSAAPTSFSARTLAERDRHAERNERAPVPAATAPDGPAAGKASGTVDMTKWCAMCERDGHDSVDCPFEDF